MVLRSDGPLRDAFTQAASYGDRSLIASVVENVRLTPGRADAIESAATAIRPDLAASIGRAVNAGRRLAETYPSASLPTGGAGAASAPTANPTPYPGGDADIPIDSLSEYQRNYSLDAMHVDAALAQGYTGKGVVVGVVDTGIDMRPDGSVHPEFAGRIDPRSTNYLYWFDHDLVCHEEDTADCETFSEDEILDAFDQGPTDPMDQQGHGTHVSGIIGAGQNGFGMQGVASGATFLAVKAITQGGIVVTDDGDVVSTYDLERCGPAIANDDCDPIGGDADEPGKAFRYLSQFSEVKVINGSFGPSEDDGAVTWDLGDAEEQATDILPEAQAMRASLDAGQIIVMAAGNARLESPILSESPSGAGLFPFIRPANATATNSAGALIYDDHGTGLDLSFTSAEALAAAEAADGKARGRIVVVVALDAYNELASYSQECGVAKEWCVSAPGGDQPAPYFPESGLPGDRGIYSTLPADNYGFESGTSMASPNVAGAVAVLIEAYPAFTPAEIVNILFVTAQDLGAPGVDAIYGWGLVRLDRALAAGPVGMTGTGTYTVGGASERTWTIDFVSGGSLDKAGSGSLDIASDVTFRSGSTVTGGRLSVDGRLTTPTLLVGQGGILGGVGNVASDVTVAGALSPGNSPGTLTVTGDLTLTASATTTIEVDGTGTGTGAGNHDRILVDGTGSVFTAGGTLAPVLRGILGSATNTFVPALGQELLFVQVDDGTVAGSFDRLSQPASGLSAGTRFDVLYYPSVLTLAATPESYADLSALGVGQTGNETALGAALDAARPAAGVRPDAGEIDLFNTLYTASAGELDQGFSSLTGQVHAEMGTTAVRAIGRFADTLGDRQLGLATDRLSAEGTPYGAGSVWAAGETAMTDIGSANGLSGYDVRATNGVVGLDWRIGSGAIGLAAGYEYADVSADRNGSGDVATYQGGIYGGADLGVLAFALRGGLSYGELSTSRVTALGGYSATASADGHGLGGFAEGTALRTFETPFVSITPSATLGYRAFNRDRMDETGSLFSLSVPDETFQETQTTLAIGLSRQFALANGMMLEPAASLGWRHDFGDLDRDTELGLLDQPFEVSGADVGRDALLGRLELTARAGNGFALGASYQGEVRDNLTSHTFSAEASFRF
ncbi:S8 family serine peptidase [Amorphus sp. 3PC139-8]